MANRIIKILNGGYLSASLYLIYDATLFDWKWWAVVIPTVYIAQLDKQQDNGN